jgi:hypothetical protein
MVGASKESDPRERPVLGPSRPDEARVLSLNQERLWYLDQLAPGSPVYNVPFVSRLSGAVDADLLERALNEVVKRHEVLRTVILPVRGTPRPFLLKRWALTLRQVDLRSWPESERAEEAARHVAHLAAEPFDLMRDVMLRCALIRSTDRQYIFAHSAPHLAFEGSSTTVLYAELRAIYSAFLHGQPSPLPALSVQYADFARWQRSLLTGERFEMLTRYWRRQLADAPNMQLPLDFPRPGIFTPQGKRHYFSVPPELLTRASQWFKEAGVSRYCGLLAVFGALLFCYTGSRDLCVGSPFGPRCEGTEHLIGFFVNTVVVRTVLSGEMSFGEVLAQVATTVREAVAHVDLTFDKVVAAVQPPRDTSRTPLFQVNFRAPKQPYPCLDLEGVQAAPAEYLDNGTAKFDLALEIDSTHGDACYFEYCTGLFKEASIVEAVADYQQLLAALIEMPATPLKQFPAVQDVARTRASRTVGLYNPDCS